MARRHGANKMQGEQIGKQRTQNEGGGGRSVAFTAVLVSLCFYALPAFLPSILVTRRHMHPGIKLPHRKTVKIVTSSNQLYNPRDIGDALTEEQKPYLSLPETEHFWCVISTDALCGPIRGTPPVAYVGPTRRGPSRSLRRKDLRAAVLGHQVAPEQGPVAVAYVGN